MNASSIIASAICIFWYFLVGICIAYVAGETDGEHLIGYAIFWPLIVLLIILAVIGALAVLAVETLYKIIHK